MSWVVLTGATSEPPLMLCIAADGFYSDRVQIQSIDTANNDGGRLRGEGGGYGHGHDGNGWGDGIGGNQDMANGRPDGDGQGGNEHGKGVGFGRGTGGHAGPITLRLIKRR